MSFEFKYRKYAEALYRALREDAFYSTMEKTAGDGDASREAMLRYMDFSMREGEKYGELYIPGGRGFGASVWAKPLSEEQEARRSAEKKTFLLHQMGEESLKTYNAIVEFMSAMAEPMIPPDCWYLSIVGVLPEFQGKGLGGDLIKDVLKKTDCMKMQTYLETFTPRNMTFYERLGYREIESFHEPTTNAEYWLMIREPSPA